MRRLRTMLVTAGPTIEDIDPVRFISNRSTGRLGVEIARAAFRAGWQVVLIHGPLRANAIAALPASPRFAAISVRSAAQMHRAVMRHARKARAVVMNAAVADFTPVALSTTKLKKSEASLVLKLKPTVDILAALGKWKMARQSELFLCGFALETGKGHSAARRAASRLKEARRKCRDKHLDLIVLDTPRAMGAERSDFTLLSPDGEMDEHRRCSKPALARKLVARIGRALP